MIGTQLGPYEILEEIGRGGMATVYRARQKSMDRDVAIKIIQRGLSDPAAVQRFQREARLIARLEHPHILPVYDFDGAHDPPYIVMRYLDGGTLEELFSRGPMPLPEAATLMRQVCAGLDYAHRQGVIHRDIKLSNILIDRDGNAFVSDFGIARSAEGPASMRLTQEGIVLGSVEYMSPEQVMGKRDLTHQSDLYALGVMLFQLLTGRLPYISDPPLGVLAMHLQAPIPSACEQNPALPKEVDEVFVRALAKKPEDRFRSAVELSAALDAALGGRAMLDASMGMREVPYLREMAGIHPLEKVDAALSVESSDPVEQNKQIVALYANAAEYAEVMETGVDRSSAYHSLLALWETFDHLVTEAGGVVLSRTDSDLLAVWGADAVHEDDAERAVRTALEMQAELRERVNLLSASEPLPLNIGIHSGMALVSPLTQPDARTGAYTVTGATVSLANRLMQAAYGVILVTQEVYQEIRGVFEVRPDLPLRVRGRMEGVPTFRVSAAKPRAFRPSTRGIAGIEARIVGREAELRRLQHAFLNAIEDAEAQAVTISGEAGVGKSRLLDAFAQWTELRPDMFYIFRGRAAGHQNRPYALLRDVVAFRFQIRDDDPPQEVERKLENGVEGMLRGSLGDAYQGSSVEIAHRIGHLCGYDLSGSEHVRPLFGDPSLLALQSRQAFIHFIHQLACADNVVMELEDLHQADDASLDLFQELLNVCASSHDDTHLALICTARPSLFSRRPDWGRGQNFHTRVDLQPLDRRESRELVGEILRKVPVVPRPLRDLLVERAEGNPYYLEELVKVLIDDRVIVPESETVWRVEESRLGSLKVPPSLAALIEARLDTLLSPERLVLLRAAVFGRVFYSGVLEAMDEADASMHGTAAHIADLPAVLDGLERRAFIRRHEDSTFTGSEEYIFSQAMLRDVVYDLLLDRQRRIYHRAAASWLLSLARAGEYLIQIADHYEQADAWEEAAQALGQAGERAYRRGLFREAEQLYERALADLPEGNAAARLTLLLGLGSAASGRGDLPKAQPVLEEALALSRTSGGAGSQATSYYLLGTVETTRGDYTAARGYFDKALPLARKHHDQQVLANVLCGQAESLFRCGSIHGALQSALECCDLASTIGDDALLVNVKNRIGTIYEMRGENEAAAATFEEALRLARQIGHQRLESALLINIGVLHFSNGNWQDATSAWEMALPAVRSLGDWLGVGITAANLAVAYVRIGCLDKVRPASLETLRIAREMHSENMMLRGLLGLGELRIAQGDLTGGMAILGLSTSHPAASADHLWEANLGLAYWQQHLNLSDDQVIPMLDAGKALHLEEVVSEYLAQS